MGWFVNPYAAAGYALMIAAWVLALVVLLASRPTRQTRALAALLVLEGFVGAGGFGIIWSTDSPVDAFAWQIVGMITAPLSAAVYLVFLSTLDTPLARPLRSGPLQAALGVVAGAVVLYLVANPHLVVTGMFRVWWNAWEPFPGPAWDPLLTTAALVSFYGLAVAADAWRRTPRGSDTRRRATLYLAAFGVRDLAWGVLYLTIPYWFQRAGFLSDLFVLVALPGASLLFCLLLAYGVLRAHLFDIDVRVRRGVRSGTLAGVFLAVFFVVATVAESYLSETFGYLVGGAAAGLLLFAIAPVQRVAERVSALAVPDARVTPEYLAFRRLEVYKAAVESAHETGGISEKERASLARLREKLKLAHADAAAIEAEVVSVA